jgi:hypothetical protein
MLTPYQQDLLLRLEGEIDESLANSPRLRALLKRLGRENESTDVGLPYSGASLGPQDDLPFDALIRETIESGPATEMTKEESGVRDQWNGKPG